MTATFPITDGQRTRWQRQAAATLGEILESNRDLPTIAWTVSAVGATLLGRVYDVGRGIDIRAVFEGWRTAIAAHESVKTCMGAGVTHLRVVARTGRVTLILTATVLSDTSRGDQG